MLTVAVAIGIAASLTAFAASSPPPFCTSLTGLAASSTEYLARHRAVTIGGGTGIVRGITDARERIDIDRIAVRATADAARLTALDRLVGEAAQTANRNALRIFRDRVVQAVKDERAAADAALLSFRSSVDELLAERERAIASAQGKLQKSIDAALATAKRSCAKASLANQAATATRRSYQEAERAYRADLLPIAVMNQAVHEREETLQRELTQASETFAIAVADARTDLRTARRY